MKTPNRSSDEGVFGVLVVIIKVVVINEEKTSFLYSYIFYLGRNRSITTPKNPSIVADGGCSYVGLIILRPEACVFRFPLSSCRSRA